jgi:hypothetical protein
MNLSAYSPLGSIDQIAIGIALVVVLIVVGWRVATGRAWRRTLPPDEVDAEYFSSTSTDRPRDATPLLKREDHNDPR